MLRRFLLYGSAGWVLEVLFTGAGNAVLERDRAAPARTYLWMHPVYGLTALALERVRARLAKRPRAVRALAYTGVIYAAEYGSGWLLRRLLGRCPWDYADRGLNVHGLVRLDYAPAWYLAGLLFEPLHDRVLALDVLQGPSGGGRESAPTGATAPAPLAPPGVQVQVGGHAS